jgi:hypothetical protein
LRCPVLGLYSSGTGWGIDMIMKLKVFLLSLKIFWCLSSDLPRDWLVEAKSMCSAKCVKEFRLDSLEDEISMLEKELSHDYLDIGFCHNDLQYGNIMLDEETRSITLIVSFLVLLTILYNYIQDHCFWSSMAWYIPIPWKHTVVTSGLVWNSYSKKLQMMFAWWQCILLLSNRSRSFNCTNYIKGKINKK